MKDDLTGFLNRALDLSKEVSFKEMDGRTYASKTLHELKDPVADAIPTQSLESVVDYLASKFDDLKKFCIHVVNEKSVKVIGNVNKWGVRPCYLHAEAKDISELFPFDQYLDLDSFCAKLQSCFEQSPELSELVELASGVKDVNETMITDDGVAQNVTVKNGPALVAPKKVRSLVTLRPFRTFQELEQQPPSSFLFRLKKYDEGDVRAMLKVADGGTWKVTARAQIKQYINAKLPEAIVLA